MLPLLLLGFMFLLSSTSFAQQAKPQLGAQVYIEPGQSEEDIRHWFQLLKEHHMTVCRIRMDETHMYRGNGEWDFSLYDMAFDAAQDNGVKIFATLFPANIAEGVGGFKFPVSEAHQESIARYIEAVVQHYKGHPALYAWVLQNEPGVGGVIPEGSYTEEAWKKWRKENPLPPSPNGYMQEDFRGQQFLRDHTANYLGWIAKEIARYDPDRHTHVNSHMLFVTLPEYDFEEWQKFLSSVGASMHPSWHFGYFERQQYPIAMAANCDIVRAGASPLPFWVTELQGGNNSYSSFNPMTPSRAEIAQWLWTGIGSGAEGIIFWTLNPRATGLEAGEWSLIDFLGEPTGRLEEAGKIAKTVQELPVLEKPQPLISDIHILYNRESMYLQKRREIRSDAINQYYEGRLPGATIKSALAMYEALLEQGVASYFSAMDDFDWEKAGSSGQTVILANQIVLPRRHWNGLRRFVQNGGKLIVTGLTAHFDEFGHNIMMGDFPFADVFGGQVREFRMEGDAFTVQLGELDLPAHFLNGTLAAGGGKEIGTGPGGETAAIENNFGKGRVLWVPSLVGLGAWQEDNGPLSTFLNSACSEAIAIQPIRFDGQYPLVSMKVMKEENAFLTVAVNKNDHPQRVRLVAPEGYAPRKVYAVNNGYVSGKELFLAADDCLVVVWQIKDQDSKIENQK